VSEWQFAEEYFVAALARRLSKQAISRLCLKIFIFYIKIIAETFAFSQ
jgi:hypothetical protein